jgi:hypothetical protein
MMTMMMTLCRVDGLVLTSHRLQQDAKQATEDAQVEPCSAISTRAWQCCSDLRHIRSLMPLLLSVSDGHLPMYTKQHKHAFGQADCLSPVACSSH